MNKINLWMGGINVVTLCVLIFTAWIQHQTALEQRSQAARLHSAKEHIDGVITKIKADQPFRFELLNQADEIVSDQFQKWKPKYSSEELRVLTEKAEKDPVLRKGCQDCHERSKEMTPIEKK